MRELNNNIRYVAGLGEKPPVTHMNSDMAWLHQYRVGRDMIRAAGVCLGDGSCSMCDHYFQPEEPRMCERYAALDDALTGHAELDIADLPTGALPVRE